MIILKNILSYYYHIIISDDKIDNGYFSYNNHLFCLYKYVRNIDEIKALVLLNNNMLEQNIEINKIIFNIYNEALTFYEGNYYVLLLINYEYHGGYFKFIPINPLRELDILKRNNWSYLWSSKIDYIEYQIKHIENSYPILINSVNYYIGLAENAISYFNMLKLDNTSLFISHRRIKKNSLFNPLELVIDYKVRDLSEYIKKSFFNGKSIYDIKKIILRINLNNIDYILLYVRMLYPSYYFDIYEEIINNSKGEDEIVKIINLVSLYEELLYEIYLIIRRKINILGVEWINKKYN